MITPQDIEKKEFSKAIRGYNDVEVDDFLDKIIVDMKNLIEENKRLKAEIIELNQEIEAQKNSETSVIGTLESAKQLMQDISASAERRAEIIIKNAKLDAETIKKDATDSVMKLNKDTETIQLRAKNFREKYRNLLMDELKSLDESEKEIFNNITPDDIEVDIEKVEPLKPEEKTETENHLNIDDIFGQTDEKDDDVKVAEKDAMTDKKTKVVGGIKVAPRKTVALDSSDIDEMLKKEGIEVRKK